MSEREKHEKHGKKEEKESRVPPPPPTPEEIAQKCHDDLIKTLQKYYPAPPAEPPHSDSSDMSAAEALLAAGRGQKVMAKESRRTLITVEDLLGRWTIVG